MNTNKSITILNQVHLERYLWFYYHDLKEHLYHICVLILSNIVFISEASSCSRYIVTDKTSIT